MLTSQHNLDAAFLALFTGCMQWCYLLKKIAMNPWRWSQNVGLKEMTSAGLLVACKTQRIILHKGSGARASTRIILELLQ